MGRLIPFGGIVGLIILLLPIYHYAQTGKIRINIPHHTLWTGILSCFLVLIFGIWWIGNFYDVSTSVHQCVIYTCVMILFTTLLMASDTDLLKQYQKIYIDFVVLMSFFGFIAWFLIFTGMVDKDSFVFDGRERGQHLFSWPYYMGLVLTNVDLGDSTIGNAVFFRASGLAEEPAWAATFVIPALILIMSDKTLYSPLKRFIYASSIVLFWLSCGAISSVLSVMALVFVSQVIGLMRKFSLIRVIVILLIILFVLLPVIYFARDIDIMSGFLESKFSSDAQTFQDTKGSITWMFDRQIDGYYFMMLFALLTAIISFVVAIMGLIRGGYASIYGYIMLYLIFIGAKRGWVWFSFDTFTIFFFYMLLYHLYHQPTSRKADLLVAQPAV